MQPSRLPRRVVGTGAAALVFPDDWTPGRIRDLVGSMRNGVWGADPDGSDDGITCVRGADFDRTHHKVDPRRLPRRKLTRQQLAVHCLEFGDIVLEKSGGGELQPVGAAVYFAMPGPAVCSNFAARVRPAAGVHPRFLSYVLAVAYRHGLNSPAIKQTTGIQNLDAEEYFASVWAAPLLEEQAAIAETIDRADRLLASAERQTEKARLVKAGLTEDLLRGGRQAALGSGDEVPWLGRIRTGWSIRPLWELLSRNDSGVWGDDPADGSGTVVLRSTDIAIDGRWTIDNPAIRRLSARERRDARLEVSDLLMTKSSGSIHHLGKTALVTHEVASMEPCFSNFTQRLRTSGELEPRFLFYLLNSPHGRRHLVHLGTTSTGLANLNAKVLGSMLVPVPPIDEQRRIAELLDLVDERNATLIALVLKRGQLRDGLMDDLVLGRVRHAAFRRPELVASA